MIALRRTVAVGFATLAAVALLAAPAAAAADPLADLSLTIVSSSPNPIINETVNVVVTLHNNGPDEATGVVVTAAHPDGLSFFNTSFSSPPTTLAISNTNRFAGTLTWPVGTIAGGGTATLTIVANRVFATSLTITAAVTSSDQADPVGANDAASVTWGASETDLVLAKAVDNPTAAMGSSVTFTLTVSNSGSIIANGVQVTDLLPAGLTFVSATASSGSYDSSTGVWILAVLLDPGGVQTLSIVATRTVPEAITNTAILTSATLDTDPGNNTATAVLTAVGTGPTPTETGPTPTSPAAPTTQAAGHLPTTGSNLGLLIGIGAGLFALGALLLVAVRQRWFVRA